MPHDLTDYFLVRPNEHGEKATYAKYSYRPGELVYLVRGEAGSERTRMSIEVGRYRHELYTMGNSLRNRFQSPDALMYYCMPDKTLAPKLSAPSLLNSPVGEVTISDWNSDEHLKQLVEKVGTWGSK